MFDGSVLGRVPTMEFEDWDLTDHKKFSHLATVRLMRQMIDKTAGTIQLDLRKWLKGVEKAGFLNLLWVSHYHRAPVTVFIIKQLLCLVHDGCLWLEEPFPITDHLIHRIT